MTILPSKWVPSTYDNNSFVMDSQQWHVNAEKPYSFTSPDNNTLRFEVRKGDQFADQWWTDPIGKERAEIADAARHSLSDEVRIEYQFMIEPGPTNTAKWLVMGQVHSNVGWSPPFEMQLSGDKLKIFGNYEKDGGPVYNPIYQGASNLERGHWYNVRIDAKFNYRGGFADVYLDGKHIVDYSGPLGYAGQTHFYWHEGVYRSTAPETMAINYRNFNQTIASDLDTVPATSSSTGGASTSGLTPTPGSGISSPSEPLASDSETGTTETLYGTAGADIFIKAGAQIMVGADGDDTYNVDNTEDQTIEFWAQGMDTVNSTVSYRLSRDMDSLVLKGTDDINGTGNSLANSVTGNAGNNVLKGKFGNDTLTGGDGRDVFHFGTELSSTDNVDKIIDYTVADDSIRLDDIVFTSLTSGELDASAFRIGASARDADDRIIYDKATGALSYDADGSGAGAAVQFAQLAKHLPMTSAAFFVV